MLNMNFKVLSDIIIVKIMNTLFMLSHTTGDFDIHLPDIPELEEEPDHGSQEGEKAEEESLEQARQELRRQRGKRARGLSFLAEDVIERWAP